MKRILATTASAALSIIIRNIGVQIVWIAWSSSMGMGVVMMRSPSLRGGCYRRFPHSTSEWQRSMVTLHGHTATSTQFRRRERHSKAVATTTTVMLNNSRLHEISGERPPDPSKFLTAREQEEKVEQLLEWWKDKQQVLCITGAGISTESGIPDYRGHDGSYHKGHKPMVHDQFMMSPAQRQRYWGRGLVGWKSFENTQPAAGHLALAALEKMGKIGVSFADQLDFYEHDLSANKVLAEQRQVSLVTQNVDTLHRRAGTKYLVELHGRADQLQCMKCGSTRHRSDFHKELETLNQSWLQDVLAKTERGALRPDGDAALQTEDYSVIRVPPCTVCSDGFLKPSVVFFGDVVPKHCVTLCQAAVDHADGVLVVGSSLAVYSAFRHVRRAVQSGKPVAILNVGETRAETEGLPGILKVEAPAGPTLTGIVAHFQMATATT